jgi:hypothetical protein
VGNASSYSCGHSLAYSHDVFGGSSSYSLGDDCSNLTAGGSGSGGCGSSGGSGIGFVEENGGRDGRGSGGGHSPHSPSHRAILQGGSGSSLYVRRGAARPQALMSEPLELPSIKAM